VRLRRPSYFLSLAQVCVEAKAQVQSGRSPTATESLFSCVAKRKVTQREGHRRFRGAPIEQRAIVARTLRKSRSKTEQRQSDALLRLLPCLASALYHRVRATMARCSTRGPLRGGESGSTGRAAGIDRDVDAFSPGQATAWMPELRQRRSGCPMSGRKARPGSRTCRAGCPASAKRGAPLFGYFLSGKREKVTRPPQEDESSCSRTTSIIAAKKPTATARCGRPAKRSASAVRR
jgi:hypothetical protein